MRNIAYLAVHCTATQQTATVESIKRYWKEEKKWRNPGYHYIVLPDGSVDQLLPINEVSNGVAGYNSVTINICYIGGITKQGKSVDNRTDAQKETILRLLKDLKERFPGAVIQGHRDFPGVKKDCPCFNAKIEYSKL